MPPIEPHEVQMRFHSCYGGGHRHKHIYSTCREGICRPDNDGRERIPKRTKPLAMGISKGGIFWGLQVKKSISFLMVTLHNVLLLMLLFVF
jgi:hypothetical protein